MLELFLHHLELLIYGLGNEIYCPVRMVYRDLLVIRLLCRWVTSWIPGIVLVTSWICSSLGLSRSGWDSGLGLWLTAGLAFLFFALTSITGIMPSLILFLSLKLSYELLLLSLQFLCLILQFS